MKQWLNNPAHEFSCIQAHQPMNQTAINKHVVHLRIREGYTWREAIAVRLPAKYDFKGELQSRESVGNDPRLRAVSLLIPPVRPSVLWRPRSSDETRHMPLGEVIGRSFMATEPAPAARLSCCSQWRQLESSDSWNPHATRVDWRRTSYICWPPIIGLL
jgi:hypothetical protein